MGLVHKDRLALVPRALEWSDLEDDDRAFLRRIYKQDCRTDYPNDRKRLTRLLTAYALSVPPCHRTEGEPYVYESVSDIPIPEVVPPPRERTSKARIHVSAPLTSHRERDDSYPVVTKLSDRLRVIDCKDGIQWILQCTATSGRE